MGRYIYIEKTGSVKDVRDLSTPVSVGKLKVVGNVRVHPIQELLNLIKVVEVKNLSSPLIFESGFYSLVFVYDVKVLKILRKSKDTPFWLKRRIQTLLNPQL